MVSDGASPSDGAALDGVAPPSALAPRSALEPPDRRGLDEQIATTIVDAVIDGRFTPGASLPPERDLAGELDVNRTSLRQALARLEQMGLIVSRQGSGNVVQDPAESTDPVVVRALARRLDPAFLGELMEIRAALGTFIGRLAAERGSDDDHAALRAALARVEAAEDAPRRQSTELDFFGALVRATGNRPMALLLRWVESSYGAHPRGFVAAFEDREAVVSGLRRISRAISRRQPAAASRAVQEYLAESGARMLEHVARPG